MRNKQVDDYIEKRFGKPDFTRTFYNSVDGRLWTPMGNKVKLWRIDPHPSLNNPSAEGQE